MQNNITYCVLLFIGGLSDISVDWPKNAKFLYSQTLRYHSLLFVGMLASLYGIYTIVTTAGMRWTGTNTLFVNIITKCCNKISGTR